MKNQEKLCQTEFEMDRSRLVHSDPAEVPDSAASDRQDDFKTGPASRSAWSFTIGCVGATARRFYNRAGDGESQAAMRGGPAATSRILCRVPCRARGEARLEDALQSLACNSRAGILDGQGKLLTCLGGLERPLRRS